MKKALSWDANCCLISPATKGDLGGGRVEDDVSNSVASKNDSTTANACRACAKMVGPGTTIGAKNGFDLQRCGHCGTVMASPLPDAATLDDFYLSYRGTHGYADKGPSKLRRARRRIRRIKRKTRNSHSFGGHFLDVGCNLGYAVEAAREAGFQALGIDVDTDTIAQASDRFGDHFQAITVEDYAAGGGRADVVYSSEVIEHVRDPESFAAALWTILNPGGLMFVTTPDAGHFRVRRHFLDWSDVTPPEHLTYFTKSGLNKLFAAQGLSRITFSLNPKPTIKMFGWKL